MSYLIYAPETLNERVYKLQSGVNTIGRQIDNTIVLAEDTVSRYHAQIHVTNDGVTIQDCQSSNHTFVNQVEVNSYQLNEDDIILCGTVIFKFVHNLTQSQLQHSNHKELLSDNFTQVPLPDVTVEQFNHEQTSTKLKILLEISQQISIPQSLYQLLHKILDLIFTIMEIDRAVILLVDETSQQLEPKIIKLQDYVENNPEFYSRKIVNFAYEIGDAIISKNPKQDQRFNSSQSIFLKDIENCLCVPLKSYNQVVGVLYVDNLSSLLSYTEDDLQLLIAVANQTALAIHLSREFSRKSQEVTQPAQEFEIKINALEIEMEVTEITKSSGFKNLQQLSEKLRNQNNQF
ncbi:FHA domain-containing protein [Cuspidothrix issatschenkoi LEGE 03284]|uniref:FHA domain-containing protein n=1 Tax=Cuspidothrix issatschenkoi TaxID=230752 RepID=UPI00188163CC|nr:FHA domain-containing protein [Cuspidothrix issatschenkoi]MBE9231008.1 FHA domain-containing protein [Cuspidothrix issatschenkoi LEGE 03284]